MKKISSEQVRADFNHITAVIHYTKAAHKLGLWESERLLIERFFPDRGTPLLEAGCGAGRVAVALHESGYRDITAFDFAAELVDQAHSLAAERNATAVRFLVADATCLPFGRPEVTGSRGLTGSPPREQRDNSKPRRVAVPALTDRATPDQAKTSEPTCNVIHYKSPGGPPFGGAMFLFNGLMQIPGRGQRRAALSELNRVCLPGAPLLFTTHDRESSPMERGLWRLETLRWVRGEQDPRLVDYGDRYFEDEYGRTFMHVPDRREILQDLEATGWKPAFDALRKEVAREPRAVRDFSDECRFWVAHRQRAETD